MNSWAYRPRWPGKIEWAEGEREALVAEALGLSEVKQVPENPKVREPAVLKKGARKSTQKLR